MVREKSSLSAKAAESVVDVSPTWRVPIAWRTRPFQTVQDAALIASLSTASIYLLARNGRLVLKRLAGRTLVETESLVKVLESAEDWTKSTRGQKARDTRIERAKASWEAAS
jgi:hypothetical protein